MTTDKLIEKYLNFSGRRGYLDFANFHLEVIRAKENEPLESLNYLLLDHISKKLVIGIQYCLKSKSFIDIEITDTIEAIRSDFYHKLEKQENTSKKKTKHPKKKNKKNKKEKGDLGKLVDYGKVSPRGNADVYWKREGLEVVFSPNDENVRIGEKIPPTYLWNDMRYLEDYYGLKAFEFGNWLSQQDRVNYLSGLGIALFDLHKLLGFAPKKISIKGKLSVAFGARGRGKALAHFEPGSFTINLTRYSRPPKEKNRSANFKRVKLILSDGGAGTFAHEYGHALDYFGGLHIERGDTFTLSGDDSTDTRPNEHIKKHTLKGLMEKLLFKIFWSNSKATIHSPYYQRLIKTTKKKYYLQRNEIFARAFEVYLQYKLSKKKHKNIFLNRVKYSPSLYLTLPEMKKLEPEFDTLINAIKKHL